MSGSHTSEICTRTPQNLDVIVCIFKRYGCIATSQNEVREMYLADWLVAGSVEKIAANAIAQKHPPFSQRKTQIAYEGECASAN